jgi:hypothetical protein
MTIAACYVSSEGVVLGVDSTSTMRIPGNQDRHYNYEQKLFELGEKSTLAIAMWGVGGLESLSYRTMIACLADDLVNTPAGSVEEIAQQWCERFWRQYRTTFAKALERYCDLVRMGPRTEEEERELWRLQGLSGGFCVAGHMQNDRIPHAFEITYGPDQDGVPVPAELQYDQPRFWGCPNLMHRLLYGIDFGVLGNVLRSQNWQGSNEDLYSLVRPAMLQTPCSLPLREAVDWIYSSIYITIKAMKFSCLAPVCGGPIEVATISSDRRFRWVTHKGLGAAITPPAYRRKT